MAVQRDDKGRFIPAAQVDETTEETPAVPAKPALPVLRVPRLSSSFPARYRVGTSPDGPQIQQLYRRNPAAVRRLATNGAGKIKQMANDYLAEIGDEAHQA